MGSVSKLADGKSILDLLKLQPDSGEAAESAQSDQRESKESLVKAIHDKVGFVNVKVQYMLYKNWT